MVELLSPSIAYEQIANGASGIEYAGNVYVREDLKIGSKVTVLAGNVLSVHGPSIASPRRIDLSKGEVVFIIGTGIFNQISKVVAGKRGLYIECVNFVKSDDGSPFREGRRPEFPDYTLPEGTEFEVTAVYLEHSKWLEVFPRKAVFHIEPADDPSIIESQF